MAFSCSSSLLEEGGEPLRRALLILLTLALLGAGGFLLHRRWSSPPLNTAVVRRGSIEAFVEATGRVRPVRELVVASEVAGRVKAIAVSEGEMVRKGQLLVELESPELEARLGEARTTLEMRQLELEQALKGPPVEEIKEAEAQLAAARARLKALQAQPSEEELAAARAAMEKAEAALKLAQAEYDKIAWREDAARLPQALALQQATLDYEAARARYEALRKGPLPAELEAARKEVEAAQARLEKLLAGPSGDEVEILRKRVELARQALLSAQKALSSTRTLAPWDGVVTEVYVEEGQVVPAYTRLLSLADVSQWVVEADVDELDIGKVKPGQEVVISLDAFPERELRGVLRSINPAPVAERGSILYRAQVEFEPGDVPLRINLSANLRIIVGKREGVLLIPRRAVRKMGTREAVKVLTGGRTEMREVVTGLSNGEEVEVLRGLREGEVIVLD